MNKQIKKIKLVTLNLTDSWNLSEHKQSMTLEDGQKVESVSNEYLTIVDEDGEWLNDIYFDDLTDNELGELQIIVDEIEADMQKTQKRIEN